MIEFINVIFQILFYLIVDITGLDPYDVFVMLIFSTLVMSVTASLDLMRYLMYIVFDLCMIFEQKQNRRSWRKKGTPKNEFSDLE